LIRHVPFNALGKLGCLERTKRKGAGIRYCLQFARTGLGSGGCDQFGRLV
jgi:hypothetical protein